MQISLVISLNIGKWFYSISKVFIIIFVKSYVVQQVNSISLKGNECNWVIIKIYWKLSLAALSYLLSAMPAGAYLNIST